MTGLCPKQLSVSQVTFCQEGWWLWGGHLSHHGLVSNAGTVSTLQSVPWGLGPSKKCSVFYTYKRILTAPKSMESLPVTSASPGSGLKILCSGVRDFLHHERSSYSHSELLIREPFYMDMPLLDLWDTLRKRQLCNLHTKWLELI